MREILFRGKSKINGFWVYGDLRQWSEKRKGIYSYKIGRTIEIVPETVGQYTGLTDKNGTKIFEGDIVRTITFGFDKEKFVTEIKFGAKYGVQGFYLANGRNMFYFGQTNLSVMDDTEVIGNIHDNPDLLGGANNETN